jgi:hypothetical protein
MSTRHLLIFVGSTVILGLFLRIKFNICCRKTFCLLLCVRNTLARNSEGRFEHRFVWMTFSELLNWFTLECFMKEAEIQVWRSVNCFQRYFKTISILYAHRTPCISTTYPSLHKIFVSKHKNLCVPYEFFLRNNIYSKVSWMWTGSESRFLVVREDMRIFESADDNI